MSNKHLSFIDINFLQLYGINKKNALEYFYSSPFYDSSSNNEVVRAKYQNDYGKLRDLIGIEYFLDESTMDEPHLYVIKKMQRRSPEIIDLIDAYYILDGCIYQCPEFLDVIRSKMWKSCFHLTESFRDLVQHLECGDHGAIIVDPADPPIEDSESGLYCKKAGRYIRECPDLHSTISQLQRLA